MILLNALISLIALLHVWFLVLEVFFWTKPLGMKTFKTTREFAESSAVLAKNQGLYNGFLASGLVWSVIAQDASQAYSLKLFFLGCVAVAGIYGGLTASKRILIIQAAPAIVAILATLFTASLALHA